MRLPFHRWLGGVLLGILLSACAAQPAAAGPFGFGFRHKTQTIVAQPGAAVAGITTSTNINNLTWFYSNTPLTDKWQGGPWFADNQADSNGFIIGSLLGTDGYPHSMPGSATFVAKALQIPRAAGDFNVTWTGTGLGSFAVSNGSVVTAPTYVGSAGSAVIHIPNDQTMAPLEALVKYTITSPANYPHDFHVTAVGSSGQFDSVFLAKTAYLTSSGGFLRPMDATGVNVNFGVTTSQLGNPAKVTATAGAKPRNLLSSGDWTNDEANEGGSAPNYTDGMPIEVGVAMANATNRNLHWNIHYNGSDDYVDEIATYARDNLNTNLTVAFELGNEVWNPGFVVQLQAKAEGISEGLVSASDGVTTPVTGPNERYVEKTIHVMDRIQAVWDAKVGTKPTLRKVFGMQNAAGGSWATLLLNYKPDGVNALKNHITHIASAPYADINLGVDQTTIPFVAYTSTQIIDQLIANTATPIANAAAIKAAAAALGVGYMPYEGGAETFFKDATFAGAVARSAHMYDFTINYLEQSELKGLPAVAWYMNTSPVSGSGAWGLDEYTGQTISLAATPKAQAVKDYNNNVRKLFAATGTLGTVSLPTSNGALVGTPSTSVSGATCALSDSDGGRLAVNATTCAITVANAGLYTVAGTRSVTLRQVDVRDATGFLDTVFAYNVSQAYRYYRLSTTATQATGGVALAEFMGATSPGGTNIFLGKTVTATSQDFGAASNAVDGNGATFWASDFGGTWPQNLTVDLGAGNAQALAEFKILARSGSQANQAPGSFTLAGSNDNVSYTTLKTLTGQTYISAETKTFSVP